jgi:hypothetical protein
MGRLISGSRSAQSDRWPLYQFRKELPLDRNVVEAMRCDRVIEEALRDLQDLLRTTLNIKRPVPYPRVVTCLQTVVATPSVQDAIEHGSDTAPSLVLRAMNRVLKGRTLPPETAIVLMWDIVLDRPEVQERLRGAAASMFLRKKPTAC